MLQLTQRRLAARLLLSLLLSLGLGGRLLPAQQTAEPDQSHARYTLQRSDVLLLTFPPFTRGEPDCHDPAGWIYLATERR